MSTGGLNQRAVSPCIANVCYVLTGDGEENHDDYVGGVGLEDAGELGTAVERRLQIDIFR